MCSVNKYAYIIFKIKFLSFSALCNDYIFNTEKMKTKYREQFTLFLQHSCEFTVIYIFQVNTPQYNETL